MMYSLRIRSTGFEAVSTLMNRMLRTVSDLTPAWPAVEAEFRKIEFEQFESEGGSGQSGKWPALSPKYKAWKERHFPGRKIMELTGRSKRSLVGRTGDSIVQYSPKRLVIGSSVPYLPFHQNRGALKKWRPVIALRNRHAAAIQAVLHRYFNGTLAGRQQSRGQIPLGV